MNQLKFFALIIFIILSCSKQNSLGPENSYGHLIIDTMEVSVLRDETPGFLYPRMQHYVKFSGHLDTIGSFGGFTFDDGFVYQSITIDGDPVSNAKFRMDGPFWDEELLEPGTEVPYMLGISTTPGGSYVFESTATVKVFTNGLQPEINSRQITGTEKVQSKTEYPVFSKDGQWIYYKQAVQDQYYIYRIPEAGGKADLLCGPIENMGNFTVFNNDSTLVYIVHPDLDQRSELTSCDISGGMKKSITTGGIFSDILISIPATEKIISLVYKDNNSSNPEKILAQIDLKTGKTDTLLFNENITYLTFRPGTKEICFIKEGDSRDIYLFNLLTKEMTLFKQDFTGSIITWAPNGIDYILEIDGNIYLYQSGSEKQLTTYPGQTGEIAFSPVGNSVAFSSWRRGEKQIWINDF